jgi:excisionase family DNA binding protein
MHSLSDNFNKHTTMLIPERITRTGRDNRMYEGHITLDLNEAANFLKISETTAQEMAASGELPGAKIGRAWVFLADDLVAWLREQVKSQRRERAVRCETAADIPVPHRITRKERRRKPPELPELPGDIGNP